MELAQADPKGLIRESYAIEGITAGECRSIFMDWALSLPVGADTPDALRSLIAHYGEMPVGKGHPMTTVLTDGLLAPAEPRRRGGRSARVPGG